MPDRDTRAGGRSGSTSIVPEAIEIPASKLPPFCAGIEKFSEGFAHPGSHGPAIGEPVPFLERIFAAHAVFRSNLGLADKIARRPGVRWRS